MEAVFPSKHMLSGLSWEHVVKSAEHKFIATHEAKPIIKLFCSSNADDFKNVGPGIFRMSSKQFYMKELIGKAPNDSVLIYGGDMNCRNQAYENQFSMLSFIASPTLLNRFREFSDRLMGDYERSHFFEDRSSAEGMVFFQSGASKFKSPTSRDQWEKTSFKDWVSKAREFLEEPLKKDASLSFPDGFGVGVLDFNQLDATKISFDYFELSHTRYFNLSEVKGLVGFLQPIVNECRGKPVYLLSGSSVVDFLFFNRFKDQMLTQPFEDCFISKWKSGYEPFLYFIQMMKKIVDGGVIVNMANLPTVEVLSIAR